MTPPDDFLRLKITYGTARMSAHGPAEKVMEAYALFREDASRKAIVAPGDTEASDAIKDTGKKTKSEQAAVPGTDQPVAVFTKRTWPNQDTKAAAIVLWAREHDKKPALKPAEIEKYWRSTSGKVPGNLAAVCGNAEKKGLVHNEGGGSYSITGHGVDEVNKVVSQ
jgi:hypothetical protein